MTSCVAPRYTIVQRHVSVIAAISRVCYWPINCNTVKLDYAQFLYKLITSYFWEGGGYLIIKHPLKQPIFIVCYLFQNKTVMLNKVVHQIILKIWLRKMFPLQWFCPVVNLVDWWSWWLSCFISQLNIFYRAIKRMHDYALFQKKKN